MIIFYIAVPTYGLIHDLAGPEETVFVLSSPLPKAQMNRPERGLIDKIQALLFPPREVPVPILQRIDLKGRIIYTDKTPYAHGIVELKSEPRYTRTDLEGYFVFVDVEEGEHAISVLDSSGNLLARCYITVERIFVEYELEAESVELIRLPDGTLVFQVAVDVEVLELTIYLRQGESGEIIGLERVDLGLAQLGTVVPQLPGEPPEPPGAPEIPAETEGSLPPGGPEGPPGAGGGEGAQPFDLDVYDTATAVRYGLTNAVKVNIFGAHKRIAPGMSGSYNFTVDNGGNSFPSLYNVTFTAADTLPDPHKIPMLYRLKAGGRYVAGDSAVWRKPGELDQAAKRLEAGERVKYTLEWFWPEGERDNEYARFGGDPAYSYSMTIKVAAQQEP
jgi:hypothetical protein